MILASEEQVGSDTDSGQKTTNEGAPATEKVDVQVAVVQSSVTVYSYDKSTPEPQTKPGNAGAVLVTTALQPSEFENPAIQVLYAVSISASVASSGSDTFAGHVTLSGIEAST